MSLNRNEKIITWLAGLEQIKGYEEFCKNVDEVIKENNSLKAEILELKHDMKPIDGWDGGAYE